MYRRIFLSTPAALFAAGCAVGTGDDMPMRGDQIPWLLWGSRETIRVVIPGGGGATTSSLQLAKIEYKRPETWSFMLGGALRGGPSPVTALEVFAEFEVIAGVGRDRWNLVNRPISPLPAFPAGFARFHWQVPAGSPVGGLANNNKFLTQVEAPPADDAAPLDTTLINWIPAQSINVGVDLVLSGDPGEYQIELFSFFAPRTHVRPDWFADEGVQFTGNEQGGK